MDDNKEGGTGGPGPTDGGGASGKAGPVWGSPPATGHDVPGPHGSAGGSGARPRMTKERYEFLKSSDEGAEAELCDFIEWALDDQHQLIAAKYNRAVPPDTSDYWECMTLQRAMEYVADWKASL